MFCVSGYSCMYTELPLMYENMNFLVSSNRCGGTCSNSSLNMVLYSV